MAFQYKASALKGDPREAPDGDPAMEKKPDLEDQMAPGIVSNPDRLKGAKGVSYLKERRT